MACGTSTVVLNRSSLPELVGDGAFLLSKKDPEYILNNLINLLENESIRKNITKKAIKRASYFTWDRCINSTINAYETLLD